MFGVASYQWDQKILICHDLGEFHPALPPPPILLVDANSLSTFFWDLCECLGEFGDASYHWDRKVSVGHHLGEISPSLPPPPRLEILTPFRPSLGPRQASWKVW
jgi:hypothetical protein